MSVGLYSHTTRGTGTVLTAAIYNADHQNHITNQNPSQTGGYGDNVAQFQLNTDPGGVGTESLPASLADDLERIRFAIKRLAGGAQWYSAPAATPGGLLASALEYTFDGGGAVLATGIKGDLEVPFNCTLTAARLFADQSGSMVVDIWRDTYANYPPVVGDSIVAAAKPTITTAVKSEDVTLTGWTTTLVAGNILRFNLDSVSSITRALISLRVTKT